MCFWHDCVISYPRQSLESRLVLSFHHYLDNAFDECNMSHLHCAEELSSELLCNKGNWKSKLVACCLNFALMCYEGWVRALA